MSDWPNRPLEATPPQNPPPYLQAPPVKPRHTGRKVVLGVLIVLLALGLLFSALINVAFLASLGTESTGSSRVVESYVSGSGRDKIAVIDVSGVLFRGDALFMEGRFDFILDQIRQAGNDRHVKAVILEVDSPGGSVTASDIIARRVSQLGEKKTVVAFMQSVAASGGYYVSAPAEKIYALPTTITGSIGVIWSSLNVKELTDKWGIHEETIKTGPLKDTGSPFKELTPEGRRMIQDVLDDAFVRFKSVVAKGRDLPVQKVDALATGGIFTARQAHELGLVDDIAYFEEVVAKTRTLAKLSQAKVVRYKKRAGLAELLFSEARSPVRDIQLRFTNLPTPLPTGLYYLWTPGLSR